MLIDSHCHLHDPEFFTAEQAEEMVKRAKANRVKKIICIGTSHEDSLVAKKFAEAHKDVYWTYGVHPESATSLSQRRGVRSVAARGLAPAARGRPPLGTRTTRRVDGPAGRAPERDKLVAIGEVGLDYHYEDYDREAQIKLFEEMLQLAVDNDLPVSFHIREAFPDFFAIIENFPKVRGVVHSFTDNKKSLKRILNETPFYVGVNGLATYASLPTPPLERTLLETDAPFLAPVPHRGGTNEPAYIADIAKWLAEKLKISVDEVEKVTTKNVNTLFKLTK